jgi:uncharacterized membrane protein
MLLTFFIFTLIFFLYFHIMDQYKKSEDLEIYETDYQSNAELQKVCSIRQPILFDFVSIYPEFFENKDKIIKTIEDKEIKVKDTDDYWIPNQKSVDYISLSYQSFNQLITTDTKAHYFTENNTDISELAGELSNIDSYLKPHFVVQKNYDLLTGSANCTTPFRYHTNERSYCIVLSGSATIRLTPWKSRKFLDEKKDYYNYEFWSLIKRSDHSPIKTVDCIVPSGKILYLPPYWWYSITFSKDTMIASISYNSLANIASNLPAIFRYYLQFHNTNKKVLTTISNEPEENIEEDTNNDSSE